MNWQPIETAPKDGTVIMLCRGERVTMGEWIEGTDTVEMDYHGTTGEPVGYPDEDDFAFWTSYDGGFNEDAPPTHWSPIPKAPEAAITAAYIAAHRT
jgi:hypothetical protein